MVGSANRYGPGAIEEIETFDAEILAQRIAQLSRTRGAEIDIRGSGRISGHEIRAGLIGGEIAYGHPAIGGRPLGTLRARPVSGRGCRNAAGDQFHRGCRNSQSPSHPEAQSGVCKSQPAHRHARAGCKSSSCSVGERNEVQLLSRTKPAQAIDGKGSATAVHRKGISSQRNQVSRASTRIELDQSSPTGRIAHGQAAQCQSSGRIIPQVQ